MHNVNGERTVEAAAEAREAAAPGAHVGEHSVGRPVEQVVRERYCRPLSTGGTGESRHWRRQEIASTAVDRGGRTDVRSRWGSGGRTDVASACAHINVDRVQRIVQSQY